MSERNFEQNKGSIRQEVETQFLNVSDAPFEIVNYGRRMGYLDYLADFSVRRRGACSAKHYYLGHKLEQLGAGVGYVSTPFYWHELPVGFNDTLRELAKKIPLQYHLSLQVSFGGSIDSLDATWDRPLAKMGFAVANIVNSKIDSPLGVLPAGEPTIHFSGEERWQWIANLKKEMPRVAEVQEFYSSLNKWVEEIRMG